MLDTGHAEQAVSYNLGTMSAMLGSGVEVPIAKLVDETGAAVEDCTPEELREHDVLLVYAGPLPSGNWLRFLIYRDDHPVCKH